MDEKPQALQLKLFGYSPRNEERYPTKRENCKIIDSKGAGYLEDVSKNAKMTCKTLQGH